MILSPSFCSNGQPSVIMVENGQDYKVVRSFVRCSRAWRLQNFPTVTITESCRMMSRLDTIGEVFPQQKDRPRTWPSHTISDERK
jgi:hypothetical protein